LDQAGTPDLFRLRLGDIWEREFMMNAATQADRVFAADTIR